MRKLFAAAAIAALTSGSAVAADLAPRPYIPPPVPVFSWTGFYIGGHVGYGWSDSSATATVAGFGPIEVQSVGGDNSGVVGGGQIGYNWQFAPNWVLGIEGDISGTGIRSNGTTPVTVGGVPIGTGVNHVADRNIDWMASIRGRLGYAADRWLMYVTGGGAWADVNHRNDLTGFAAFNPIDVNRTRSGWVVGGGVEYAVTNNWTVRAEYLYYDFGDETIVNVSPLAPGLLHTTTWETKVNVVRAGVNYKF